MDDRSATDFDPVAGEGASQPDAESRDVPDRKSPATNGATEQAEQPSKTGSPPLEAELRARTIRLLEKTIRRFSENAADRKTEFAAALKAREDFMVSGIVAGVREQVGMAELVAATQELGDQLRIFTADFHRSQVSYRAVNRWLVRIAAAACVPLLLLAGAALQHQLEIWPVEKTVRPAPLWAQYGPQLRQCVAEAARRNKSLRCEILVRP